MSSGKLDCQYGRNGLAFENAQQTHLVVARSLLTGARELRTTETVVELRL